MTSNQIETTPLSTHGLVIPLDGSYTEGKLQIQKGKFNKGGCRRKVRFPRNVSFLPCPWSEVGDRVLGESMQPRFEEREGGASSPTRRFPAGIQSERPRFLLRSTPSSSPLGNSIWWIAVGLQRYEHARYEAGSLFVKSAANNLGPSDSQRLDLCAFRNVCACVCVWTMHTSDELKIVPILE